MTIVMVISLSQAQATSPPMVKVLEAQRRMNAATQGNSQRIARLRTLEKQDRAADAAKQQPKVPKLGSLK
jgi:hypothetical protein